jgi:hypothetical protein
VKHQYSRPARVVSLGGNKYYFLFKDLSSQEEKVYFLKAKSETFGDYKKYEAWALAQCGAHVKIFGCDCGGELTSKSSMSTLRKLVLFATSLSMTPQLLTAQSNEQTEPT